MCVWIFWESQQHSRHVTFGARSNREGNSCRSADQIYSSGKRRSICFDVYAARVQFQSVLGRKLSSSAAQQQSQEQTRRRRNQDRLARLAARIVLCFIGNLVEVLAVQVLDLLADDISLFVYVIVGL